MRYTEQQICWIKCNCKNYVGKLDNLLEDFNSRFGTSKTKRSIESLMMRKKIRNRYFGEEQKEWLKNNALLFTWGELAAIYNEVFGEDRSRKSIICVCHRMGITKE